MLAFRAICEIREAPVQNRRRKFGAFRQFSIRPVRYGRKLRAAQLHTGAQRPVIDAHLFQPQIAFLRRRRHLAGCMDQHLEVIRADGFIGNSRGGLKSVRKRLGSDRYPDRSPLGDGELDERRERHHANQCCYHGVPVWCTQVISAIELRYHVLKGCILQPHNRLAA